jgi:hypothetical protein
MGFYPAEESIVTLEEFLSRLKELIPDELLTRTAKVIRIAIPWQVMLHDEGSWIVKTNQLENVAMDAMDAGVLGHIYYFADHYSQAQVVEFHLRDKETQS